MSPQWHGYVGWRLTAKDGTYCGNIGLAFPCDSQEDGWQKAIAWLRKGRTLETFLVHTFEIKVRFF